MSGGATGQPPLDPDSKDLKIDAEDLKILVKRIRRGDDKTGGGCILLLGPGVAIHPMDSQGLPLTISLARQLADDLKISQDDHMRDNFRYVAQVYFKIHGRNRDGLALYVQEFYSRFRGQTTRFHQNLAQLPFRLCINTSPDDYMWNAFREAGKNPQTAYYDFKRFKPSPDQATEKRPLVYYLYGNADDEESLVLTEEDLIEFLVNVVQGNPRLPDFIKAALSDEHATFLFLGFGFRNWYLRVLLHVLQIYGHERNARFVALEDESFFGNPESQETVGFFSEEHLIEFKQVSWDQFAIDLLEAYCAAPRRPALVAEPGPDAPRAFLSYVHADQETVKYLEEKLKQRGVAIWRDEHDLRAGDKWALVIKDVIKKKKVDYVIVAQSRQMTARIETKVGMEIELALTREADFLGRFRFVIPVTLDDCQPLEVLSHLHSISVADEAGVARLADAILEDWEKRREVKAQPLPAAASTGSA